MKKFAYLKVDPSKTLGEVVETIKTKEGTRLVVERDFGSRIEADANCFEIIVSSNIQLKFIEQKRATLIDHLQNYFENKNLTYQLTLIESAEDTEPRERPLNTKEQFFKIAEQYPLVKELKDRLNLELDY